MSNSDDTIKRLLNNLNLGTNKANLGDFVLELVRRIEEVEAGGGGLTPEQEQELNSIATAMGNRIRVDEEQTFSAAEKLQACTNIGVGDPEHDLVAEYNTAKA